MFLLDVTCGDGTLVMNEMIPELVSTAIDIIKIVIPILLVMFGMLDLGRAVMAQKEDEIKKGQQLFVKRLISAVVVFLVVMIVELVIGIVAPRDENKNIWNCFDCLVNNECVEVK